MNTTFARCLVTLVVSAVIFVRTHGQNGAAPQEVGQFACGACFVRAEDGTAQVVPLESTEVVLDVKPGLLEAEVIQSFSNRGTTVLEAVYRYPLPPAATLTHFELHTRDGVIVSEVREKREARAVYETAKSEGRRTALLEQLDPSLFSTAVANFQPGETVRTVIRFIQPLDLRADGVDVRFPMVTGTRYFPAGTTPRVDGAISPTPPRAGGGMWGPGHVYAFDIRVTGIAVERIESESHRVRTEARGPFDYTVALEDEVTVPDRDFVLRILRRPGDALEPTWVTQHTATGDYGMLTVFPPCVARSGTGEPVRPRDILFLLDRSGSMEGKRLASAKKGVDLCLQALRPDDRFQIVPFSSGYSFYARSWTEASRAEVERARACVRDLQTEGGTELQKALAASLDAFEPVDRDQVVIALTDGDVGAERALVTMIEKKLRRARVFVLGIGDAPNPHVVVKMAECGRGQARFIARDSQIARELADLFATLDAPVFTGAQVAFYDEHGDIVSYQTFPDTLPDVFLGRPIQMVARFTQGLPAGMVIHGLEGGRPFSHRVPLSRNPWRGVGLEKLFGARWIDDLEDMHRRSTEGEELLAIKREIIETALLFQLVTEHTSRVAVDRKAVPGPPAGPIVTVKVAQAHVADQGAVLDPNNEDTIILSPFEVSCEEDTGYSAGSTLAGTRLRTELRDVAACVNVVTREFLSGLGATSLEDALPYAMDLDHQAVVNSGLDSGYTDTMPVATIVAPEMVARITNKSFGPAWRDVELLRAGSRGQREFTARFGADDYAAGALEWGGALDGAKTLSALALVSWDRAEADRWGALVDVRKDLGPGRLGGKFHGCDLEGYGRAWTARASWAGRLTDDLRIETTVLRHALERDDAAQFHLGAPRAAIDGLGFHNLDLLTADTRSIDDTVVNAQMSGLVETLGARHAWSLGASGHRREAAWVTAIEGARVAPQQDTFRLEIADQIRFGRDLLTVAPAFSSIRYQTPGQSQSTRDAKRVSLETVTTLTDMIRLFAGLNREEFLQAVPTGTFVLSAAGLIPLAAAPERHAGGQIGVRVEALEGRVSGQFGWFHSTIAGHTYRDWRWEGEHTATGPVWLDESTIREPVSRGSWPEFVREGWIGSLHLNPTRELTGTVSWCIETKDAGPYRGGNRRASFLARYSPSTGPLARARFGIGAAWRNDMLFDDGYLLRGGLRWDLMLGYDIRRSPGEKTRLQVNWTDATDSGLQPTRFAAPRGRRWLLSVTHGF